MLLCVAVIWIHWRVIALLNLFEFSNLSSKLFETNIQVQSTSNGPTTAFLGVT